MAEISALSVSGRDRNGLLLAEPDSVLMRSSKSRITLVDSNAELETKVTAEYDMENNTREFSRLDHLLAALCIPRRDKKARSQSLSEPEHPEIHIDSPWVLPVYVLSTQKDASRHLIPKEAKCTIDTGNLQGNIVSRAFVVDVLGYSESDFQKLTKEEENGATGVTGHRLMPEGAIYLTWYHNNSTRIFRDMRFLISEHPMYDLIIGSYSIQKNKILDVPNLLTIGLTIYEKLGSKSRILEKLKEELHAADDIVGNLETDEAGLEQKLKRELRRKHGFEGERLTREVALKKEEYIRDSGLKQRLTSAREAAKKANEAYDVEAIRLYEEEEGFNEGYRQDFFITHGKVYEPPPKEGTTSKHDKKTN